MNNQNEFYCEYKSFDRGWVYPAISYKDDLEDWAIEPHSEEFACTKIKDIK